MEDVNKIWIKILTFRISVSPNLFSISVDFSVSSMARQINKWKFLHGRSVQNTCQTKNKNKIRSIIVIEASLTKCRLLKIANMLKVLLYVLSMNSCEWNFQNKIVIFGYYEVAIFGWNDAGYRGQWYSSCNRWEIRK